MKQHDFEGYMEVPMVDQPHEILFDAEENFEATVELLQVNRRQLTELQEHFDVLKEQRMLCTAIQSARELDHNLDESSYLWVDLYLQRKRLLNLFTHADQNLRAAQDYLKGFVP